MKTFDPSKLQNFNADKMLKTFTGGDFKNNTHIVKLPEGLEFFDFKGETEVSLNIIPYPISKKTNYTMDLEVGEYHSKVDYHIHRVGASPEPVICNKKMFGTKCPVCEYTLENYSPANKEILRPFYTKYRQLYYVTTADEPGKLYVLDMAYSWFGALLEPAIKSYQKRSKTFALDIEDRGATFDITLKESDFVKKSKGASPLMEAVSIIPRQRDLPVPAEIMKDLKPLDSFFIDRDYKAVKELLYSGELPFGTVDDFTPAPPVDMTTDDVPF